jgi:hypothetical protein
MDVDFTPDQKALVQRAIESGRLDRPEDAVKEAFSLWAERERRRSEILALVDKSEASFAQGKGRTVTTNEDVKKLVDDVKQRGMARLVGEQITSR